MATPNTVPKEKYNFLDVTIPSLFRDDHYLNSFAFKTVRFNIHRIGTFISMTEDELFRRIPTSKTNKAKIIEALARNGLHFGMTAPGWSNPDPR